MREILFRGKRIDNGQWVYGYYLVKSERHIIWDRGNILLHNVNKDTIGQFTGLTDKNGLNIFEGDVVETTNDTGEKFIDEVKWEKWDCSFRIAKCYFFKDGIVIGNIHNNPKLL